MKLYNANLSPNALRVRAVVNELGIALEAVSYTHLTLPTIYSV